MLIGCPKCGGMVLIERPPTGETPAAEGSGAETASAEIRSSEALFDETPAGRTAATSSGPLKAEFDHVHDLLAEPEPAMSGEADQHDVTRANSAASLSVAASFEVFEDAAKAADRGVSPAPPPLNSEEPALDPGSDWTSRAVEKWRPWLLSAGAGLLGVACAVGVIRLVVAQRVGAELSDGGAPVSDAVSDDANPLAKAANPTATDDESVSPAGSATTDEGPDPQTIAAETVGDDTPNVDEPEPNATATANIPESPGVRDQFSELADLSHEPLRVQPVATAVGPDPTNEDDEFAIEASRPPGISVVNKATPLALDPNERLADSIPEIRLQEIPLCRFLELVSDLMAVPVTLRWEGAMHAGVSAQKVVDLDAADATLDQILTDVLTPLRLSHYVDETQIVVTKAESLDQKLRITKYFVGDLIGTEANEIEALVELVKQVVAPGSWHGDDGDGGAGDGDGGAGQVLVKDRRLYMKQGESAHFEAILFLEKLRVARGLSPRSSYPRELFDLRGRRAMARELLTRPVHLRVRTSLRLAHFFRALSAETGCDILPDWPALAAEGWLPHCEVTYLAGEIPFHDVLQQIADNLQLTYRVLDRRTIEITTESAELRQPEFGFYDVSELIDQGLEGVEIIARLKQAIGADQFTDGGGAGVVAYDAVSKRLIVRLPQSQQILVADFLSTWGA